MLFRSRRLKIEKEKSNLVMLCVILVDIRHAWRRRRRRYCGVGFLALVLYAVVNVLACKADRMSCWYRLLLGGTREQGFKVAGEHGSDGDDRIGRNGEGMGGGGDGRRDV